MAKELEIKLKNLPFSLNKTYLPDFDPKLTLMGGQTFSWKPLRIEGLFLGITQTRAIIAKYKSPYLLWQTFPNSNDSKFISEYFRIRDNLSEIKAQLSKDPVVAKAVTQIPGLRLLKQPFYETVFSFLLSSNRSIKLIRKSVWLLAEIRGKTIKIPGIGQVHLFPTAEAIAGAKYSQLKEAKVGFRAKFLKLTARAILSAKQPTRNLTAYPGIGPKIADCIEVFALGNTYVTPIDVWVKRLLIEFYGLPDNRPYLFYKEWLSNRFGYLTAYAGQYLYEWYRKRSRAR